MKRTCALLFVALGAGAIAPAALADAASTPPAPAPPPTVVPPALPALEQKLAQIRFHSLSFSTRLDLGVQDSPSSSGISISAARAHRLIVSTTGVFSLSPLLLSSTSTTEGPGPREALGGVSRRERRIGATTYLYDPFAARRDGGRPWIRSTRSRSEERLAAKLAPITDALDPALAGLEQPAVSSTGPFAPLLELLGQALSIQEAGPATVDGQQTLAFTATLSTARLLERAFSGKERRSLLEGKRPPNTDFTLELWLAPSGLPVRTTTTNRTRGEEFSSQEDILGLEVPVLVHAPPADQTISQARWTKIEQRNAKAISRCIRRRPRRAQACVKQGFG